jgi:thiamine-phosphate pyrophosphorylase
MDAVEHLHRLADLVGLQGSDQMQRHAWKTGAQGRPFAFGFLDAVFPEDPVARFENGQDARLAMAFADGDEMGFLCRRESQRARGRDARENSLEIPGRIDGYGSVFGDHIMASVLARAKLARAARLLNARHAHLPPLILMTDQTRTGDPFAAARALPKGAAIILRHTDDGERAALAQSLRGIARRRGLRLLIAGDAPLAARLACDGLHLSEARSSEAAHWKALHPDWLITAAAHSLSGVGRAARARCDAVLFGAVFATQSHVGRASFGVSRFRILAQSMRVPVYALGGVNAGNVQRLTGARLAGIAAIDALTATHSA